MQKTMLIGLDGFLMKKKETRPYLNLETMKRFQCYYKFMKQKMVPSTTTSTRS
jgi:hypothetical protein